MTDTLPDIPRIYTALAEWGACIVYVLLLAKTGIPWARRAGFLAAGLLLLVLVQILAQQLPLELWMLGMAAAFGTMFAILRAASGAEARTVGYVGARAVVLAELVASLHWQLTTFVAGQSAGLGRTGAVLAVLTFGAAFALAYLAERRLFLEAGRHQVSSRDLVVATMLAIATFSFSNLSFISPGTPFSARLGKEIFYVRTLVDLCGFIALYAHHEQRLRARAAADLASMRSREAGRHEQYVQSRRNLEQVARLTHDLRHLIEVVRSDRAESEQLDRLEDAIRERDDQIATGHPVLDVVLTEKARTCRLHGITFTCVVDGALLEHLDTMDVVTLFGNALDNAIEASLAVPDEERRLVRCAVHGQGAFVIVRVENWFEHRLHHEDGELVSTKADGEVHGFGVRSIRETVRRYGGECSLSTDDGWFRLRMLLPAQR